MPPPPPPPGLRSLRTEIVRSPCGPSAFTVPVRGLCNATYDMSTGYGAYDFCCCVCVKLLAKPNRRGRAEPVNPYENFTAASCLRTPQGGLAEAAWKGGYGQDTGSVDP